MPAPNNPSIARVALRVGRDTRQFINTFHLARTDNAVLGATDVVVAAAAIANWWDFVYSLYCTTAIFPLDVVATKLDPSDPQQSTQGIFNSGQMAAVTEAANVSAATSWRTGLAGRKNRGRFYAFSIPEGVVLPADTITGAYQSQLASSAGSLLTTLAAVAMKLVIFHRSTNTATDVLGVVVDSLVDSMRNRLAGRGI